MTAADILKILEYKQYPNPKNLLNHIAKKIQNHLKTLTDQHIL